MSKKKVKRSSEILGVKMEIFQKSWSGRFVSVPPKIGARSPPMEYPVGVSHYYCIWKYPVGVSHYHCIRKYPVGVSHYHCIWKYPVGVSHYHCI